MDKIIQTTTLVQTGKISKPMPMVLFGTEYWDDVLNMEKMAEWGTISGHDPTFSSEQTLSKEAFEYLTSRLDALEQKAD